MKRKLAAMLALIMLFTTCFSSFARAAEVRKYSIRWYQTIDGKWHITKDGVLLKNTWVLDDECDVEGGLWYLIDENGDMVSDELIVDSKGNYYSFQQEHDGHFGTMRTGNGTYNGIVLTFNHVHDGTFGAVTSPAGIEAVKARSGVREMKNLDSTKIIRTSEIKNNSSSGSGGGGGSDDPTPVITLFTLHYDPNGVTFSQPEKFADITLEKNQLIPTPATPTDADKKKEFDHWYDADGTKYDFANNKYYMTGPLTLIADWKDASIPVTGISLNQSSLDLTVGDDVTLTATITPNNATDQDVIWSSSDETIATVDENGKITAVAEGNATITAKAHYDKSIADTCSVTVKPNYLTFTADGVPSTIKLSWNDLEGPVMYSTDGGSTWNPYATRGTEISLNSGESVKFKANRLKTNGGSHFEMTGKILASGSVTSLTDGVGGKPELGYVEYVCMFDGCTALKTAPELPSETMGDSCYCYMFRGCTGLTTAPELPATTLASSCYESMFDGCTGLTAAPELPATTLADRCYNSMFVGCTALKTAPELPAETLTDYCYYAMFKGCSSLLITTTAIEGQKVFECPAVGSAEEPITDMFKDTSDPTIATPVPGTTYYYDDTVVGDYLTFTADGVASTIKFSWKTGSDVQILEDGESTWKDYSANDTISLAAGKSVKFKGTNVTTGYDDPHNNLSNFKMTGKIKASGSVTSLTDGLGINTGVTLTDACYSYMFKDCDVLTSAPDLPALTLVKDCYHGMFEGCTSLTAAPSLEASELATSCYEFMFSGCSALITAPSLDAATMKENCYGKMFQGCTSLTAAPSLNASELATSCYESMFSGCTALTAAPVLNATTLAHSCYQDMFSGCTKLTSAPTLGAATMEQKCYSKMFQGCTALETAPALPATALANYCYQAMFQDCTSLTAAPNLPAATLKTQCYSQMFKGCSALHIGETDDSGIENIIFAPTVDPDDHTIMEMFSGTAGPYTGDPEKDKIYYNAPNYLTFTSKQDGSWVKFNWNTAMKDSVKYSTDGGKNWNVYASGTQIDLDDKKSVQFIGDGVTTNVDNHFVMNGIIEASGSATSLTDGKGGKVDMGTYAYCCMFKGCTALKTAPELPSTTLADACYCNMFEGCTALEAAPKLPATTLADCCYDEMFKDCTKLATAPKLPATTLASRCYGNMFSGCTALETAPELPAAALESFCYLQMFYGCTALTTAPKLPATTLAEYCYKGMFSGCTSLYVSDASASGTAEQAWKIPTSGTFTNSYNQEDMFKDCLGTRSSNHMPGESGESYTYYTQNAPV